MTRRSSKLNWFKSLHGADLTPSETYVLVILANHSDERMENAYPSVETLATGSGMTERNVQLILRRLVAKGAIAVTQQGGNQVRKGFATVYQILTPPQRAKGEVQFTLQDPKSGARDDSQDSGRVKSGAPKGEILRQGRVKPSSPHQVLRSGPIDHSDSLRSSGAAAAQQRRDGDGISDGNDDEKQDQKRLDESDVVDLGAIEDRLAEELGLTPAEMTKVDAMLQRGSHVTAVRNQISYERRLTAAFEEPRCQKRGVAESRHGEQLQDPWPPAASSSSPKRPELVYGSS